MCYVLIAVGVLVVLLLWTKREGLAMSPPTPYDNSVVQCGDSNKPKWLSYCQNAAMGMCMSANGGTTCPSAFTYIPDPTASTTASTVAGSTSVTPPTSA